MAKELSDIAREAFYAAVEACGVEAAVGRRVAAAPGALRVGAETIDLSGCRDVRVAAVGKAADRMMASAAALLDVAGRPDASRRGLVVAHAEQGVEAPAWAARVVGSHPAPDERSLRAGRLLLDLFEDCGPDSLALFLLSGGGSALAEWPLDPALTAHDLTVLNESLVRSSAPIRGINAVRKHLSAIKGGRLALAARAALQLTLVVSDVTPGDLQSVASGPTLPDETTVAEVLEVTGRPRFLERLTPALRSALDPAALVETPKAADLAGLRSHAHALLDSRDAARAAAEAVRGAGAEVALLDGPGEVDGPLEEVVDAHLRALEALVAGRRGGTRAVVSAGEVTLEVTGGGLGGRNQQSVLYALTRARELCPSARELVVLSAGTDGRDGPTEAAGAVAGLGTLGRGRALGLDPAAVLFNNDAHRFFEPLGALLETGPTGTNVRDLRILLAR